MSMLLVLALTASAATHHRHTGLRHGKRVVPRLQAEDVFHDDFVHDDTLHPEQAVKTNIRESENKLKEAEKELEELQGQYKTVRAAKDAAAAAHEAQSQKVVEAQTMVEKLKKVLASAPEDKKALAKAEETVTAAEDAVNTTDQAATAAAETVKQAQDDLHESIMALVDAKDNRSDAEAAVRKWKANVDEASKANVTLAEWTKKLNATNATHKELEAKMDTAVEAYEELHGEYKEAEARLSEAEKIFDIDRTQYEEYIGPYPPEPKSTENLWWDALQDGNWHLDWPHF
jgi:chromosome segregation ATPase